MRIQFQCFGNFTLITKISVPPVLTFTPNDTLSLRTSRLSNIWHDVRYYSDRPGINLPVRLDFESE